MREIRAGVAGAGVFGGHHARKYAALSGVQLTAVFDPTLERAQALATPMGAAAFDDYPAFLDAVDAVTITAPAHAHAGLALAALQAGRHVYVEKPLATTQANGLALIEAAGAAGVVLACGHQERMVFAAMGLFAEAARPTLIEAVRRGLPSERNRDVSCAVDLMIHDLDLAAALAGGPPVTVEAHGGYDELTAEIAFEGGAVARLHASRIAEARERTMRLAYASGEVDVDFLAPSFRNTSGLPLDPAFAESVDGKDPLGRCVSGFLAAVRGEMERPPADGRDGLEALELALAVERAAGLA